MEQISYKQRNCTDKDKIDEFLIKSRIGTLGMQGEIYPYTLPVNYIWQNGSIYFHGMGSGKKTEILAENPNVCFTVFEEYGTVKDSLPCHADTSYLSVIIFGSAVKVTDYQESARALQGIVEKYMPGFYKSMISENLMKGYRSSHDNNPVNVYKIIPDEMTAKENAAKQEDIFTN